MTIHRNLPFNEYLALPGWNWSKIKLIKKSPRHVKWAMDNPDAGDTPSRMMLRAIHTLVLEPHWFDEDFAVYDGARNKKHAAYQAFLAAHPNATILTPKDEAKARETAAAVLAKPAAQRLMEGGEGEVSLTWTDEETGLPCKARVDWLVTGDDPRFLDLKTWGTTDEFEISRMMTVQLVNGQQAHYLKGLQAHGLDPESHLIIAEGHKAQDVAVVYLSKTGALHHGERLRRELMQRIAVCVETDDWPGRHEEIIEVDVQEWAKGNPDDELFGNENEPEEEMP